jgi:hypothetical protein
MKKDEPFKKKISVANVRKIIDFNVAGSEESKKYRSLAKIQASGVAALYNILCERNFAYCADEVGMGKTYQALGLASILWCFNPDARIVFLVPRENLQGKWERDYENFIANNYRRPLGNHGDDIVRSLLLKSSPVIKFIKCNNLFEFARSLYLPGKNAYCIRHTSFRRVANFNPHRNVRGNWKSFRDKMMQHGLHSSLEISGRLTKEKAIKEFNKGFATAMNSLLKKIGNGDKAIDLLIVDEAQYLRNPGNIGNTMLRSIFKGQVRRWLYMSATPLHSGDDNIRKQINDYAMEAESEYITEGEVKNRSELQRRMQTFLIRRPRTYVDKNYKSIEKTEYRHHAHEEFAYNIEKVLPTLSMALVQKSLVKILNGQNNRFKVGFLSSFESLEDSIHRKSKDRVGYLSSSDGLEDSLRQKGKDFEVGDNDDDESTIEGKKGPIRAPDEKEVSRYSSEFERKFKIGLQHPKIESMVESIWEDAFIKNEKYLIFVRRISTVRTLKKRLEERYYEALEDRIKSIWNETINWEVKKSRKLIDILDEQEPDPETDTTVEDEEEDRFRKAMAKNGWLDRFRRKFQGNGVYAMFFQENWLRVLCNLGGKNINDVADAIPEHIWRESRNFARRGRSVYHAQRFQYIVVHLLKEKPELFGLEEPVLKRWRTFLQILYHSADRPGKEIKADRQVKNYKDTSLIASYGFWDKWNDHFESNGSTLLGDLTKLNSDQLIEREIKKNWIGQYLRLSDSILDFYYAEKNGDLVSNFFSYFTGEYKYSHILWQKLSDWIEHYNLILKNCFSYGDEGLARFASHGTYPVLNNQTPVIGIIGGSPNERALKQFKTPGYPQIIVCTDVLKEGLDLHTFCDKIIHYGVAWTAGDMEQRVGRIDRYFSKIERRLYSANDKSQMKLNIYYPHIRNSLEKEQVEKVVARQKLNEKLMDNIIVAGRNETRDLVAGNREILSEMKAEADKIDTIKNIHPYNVREIRKGSRIPYMSEGESDKKIGEYKKYARKITNEAEHFGILIEGDIEDFEREFKLKIPNKNGENTWNFKWHFAPQLGYYYLKGHCRLQDVDPLDDKNQIPFAYESEIDNKQYVYNGIIRLYVPSSNRKNKLNTKSFMNLCTYLKSEHTAPEDNASELKKIKRGLESLHIVRKVTGRKHKLTVYAEILGRKPKITLYVYKGMYLITSRVASLSKINIPDNKDKYKWVYETNRQLTFGFLSIHKKGLYFCERFFQSVFNKEFIERLIEMCATRTDLYKMYFMGRE